MTIDAIKPGLMFLQDGTHRWLEGGEAEGLGIDESLGLVLFQNGPVPENGKNGIQIEDMLEALKERLDAFQRGPFPSRYNDLALNGIDAALEALHERTLDRVNRGVEGKYAQ